MVKSIEMATKRYARNSMRAYLEGKKNLNWAMGAVRSSGVHGQILEEIFEYLKNYGEVSCYEELYAACKKEGWL